MLKKVNKNSNSPYAVSFGKSHKKHVGPACFLLDCYISRGTDQSGWSLLTTKPWSLKCTLKDISCPVYWCHHSVSVLLIHGYFIF